MPSVWRILFCTQAAILVVCGGVSLGIKNIIAGLKQAISGKEQITVLLETMSGKGTEIGATFEQKAIRDGLYHPEQVGICLDTCHIFAAGYDIVNDLD